MKNKFGKETFYKVDHTYYCRINYKDHIFIGETTCHPEDIDFETECTGYTIAEYRAEIKRLRFVRDETQAELRAMERLRATARIFKGSNVERHLLAEISSLTNKISLINETICDIQNLTKEYIERKDMIQKFSSGKKG